MSINSGMRHVFTLMHLDGDTGSVSLDDDLSIVDRWILSRALATAEAVKTGIDSYKFNEAASAVYQFVWHEFCDWYLEASKPALYEKEGRARRDVSRRVLAKVLKDILIMLHPFMPFVTEEIWSIMPTVKGSIMEAGFPFDETLIDTVRNIGVEEKISYAFALVTAIRNIRGEMNIAPSAELNVSMQTPDDNEKQFIQENSSIIKNLSRLESLVVSGMGEPPASCAAAVVSGTIIYVSLKGVIDFDKEEQRLEKELEKVTKELLSVSKRLSNESFLDKAPEDVVDKVRLQKDALEDKAEKLKVNLDKIKKINL